MPFYEELADRLLPFRDDRPALIERVSAVYGRTGIKMPTLQSAGTRLSDLDPFTVFGLFNKGITNANRLAIAGALKEELGVGADLPEEFDGIPVLNNLNATFYPFVSDAASRPGQIDDLWDLFAAALAYADDPAARGAFVEAYDRARDIPANNRKLTMGLYWVRPRVYLNLDNRNTWFIEERSGLSADLAAEIGSFSKIPEGDVYLRWCEAVRAQLEGGEGPYRDFVGLSAAAWVVSEEVSEEKRVAEEAAPAETEEASVRCWLFSPGHGGAKWDEFRESGIMAVGWDELGDLGELDSQAAIAQALQQAYDSGREPMNDSKCLWEFSHVMAPGDVVFAKRGARDVIGRGVVRGDYRFDEGRETYQQVRDIEWTHAGQWTLERDLPSKTLTDITGKKGYLDVFSGFFTDESLIARPESSEPEQKRDVVPYTREDFLREVYMDEEDLETLEYLVRHKKNVVLEGAPGTGKTFCARRLAWELMGERDDERVVALQFHQSYSYEDFVEGWRPTQTGFELRHGAFHDVCRRAQDDPGHEHFLLIDEINRANMSKVLGELFSLLEADKRGHEVRLLYSGEAFSVPGNLYVIGTMNTADRSLAMIDYALRRRFAFFPMTPAFSSTQFAAYAEGLESPAFDALTAAVVRLNAAIAADDALGPGFAVGHSYLCNLVPGQVTAADLRRIVRFEVGPLLREYWFDEPDTAAEWIEGLLGALG